jgi:hypothetical protein
MSTLKIRRHRPSWTTRVKPLPTGTFVNVNEPLVAVVVETRGSPAAVAPQISHFALRVPNGANPGSDGLFAM